MDSPSIDTNTKISMLRNQACFSKLTEEEIGKLAGLLAEVEMKPGDVIVTEGDAVDSVFLIISGTADVRRLVVKNKKAENESVATLSAGNAIGLNETGFYSLTGKRTATVVALSDMVLLKLSVAEFHGFALAYHHVNEIMRKNAEDYLDNNPT